MPAAGTSGVGAKLVTFYPNNAEHGLHTHMAVIVLFKPETGEPLVAMDGRLITEMRTAAVTAAYVQEVAPKEAKSLAILGAGTQAKSHIEALRCVRDFSDLRVWNRTPEKAEALAKATGGKAMDRESGGARRGCRGGRDLVQGAGARGEVAQARAPRWRASGWAGRDVAELDAAAMANTVIVDSREGALGRVGEHPRLEARHPRRARRSAQREPAGDAGIATVVFVSMGMACEDIAAASLVYETLVAKGERMG